MNNVQHLPACNRRISQFRIHECNWAVLSHFAVIGYYMLWADSSGYVQIKNNYLTVKALLSRAVLAPAETQWVLDLYFWPTTVRDLE